MILVVSFVISKNIWVLNFFLCVYIYNTTTDIIYIHTYIAHNFFFLNSSLTTVHFLLSDLIDTDKTNCHIVSNAYWDHRDSLPPANTTVYIHSFLANKLSLAHKVTGKVTNSDAVLQFFPAIWRMVNNFFFLNRILFLVYFKIVYYELSYKSTNMIYII